jgi:hypothetical protein
VQFTDFFFGLIANASTNCEISFIKAELCYGPAAIFLTGTNLNGGVGLQPPTTPLVCRFFTTLGMYVIVVTRLLPRAYCNITLSYLILCHACRDATFSIISSTCSHTPHLQEWTPVMRRGNRLHCTPVVRSEVCAVRTSSALVLALAAAVALPKRRLPTRLASHCTFLTAQCRGNTFRILTSQRSTSGTQTRMYLLQLLSLHIHLHYLHTCTLLQTEMTEIHHTRECTVYSYSVQRAWPDRLIGWRSR